MTSTGTWRGTITLDPTKTPGRFERTIVDVPESKVKGTYRLEGDTLKLYEPMLSGSEPPVDLPEEPARGYELEVWKRAGETGGAGLDGDWKLAAFLMVGKRDISSMMGERVMRIQGGTCQFRSDSLRRCTIKVDPSQSPKHFDMTFEETALRGRHTQPRVYRLEGDRLTVWQSFRGRPTEVSDAADSEAHFQVFERVNGTFRGLVDRMIQNINQNDQDAIQEMFAPSLQNILTRAKMTGIIRDKLTRRGKILRSGIPVITGRTARTPLVAERGEWELLMTIDTDERVTGFHIFDLVPPIFVPQGNSIPMRLPFEGEWFVIEGGGNRRPELPPLPQFAACAAGRGLRHQRRGRELVLRDRG
jgi:uncharacterized protein (TIGR03067 family)